MTDSIRLLLALALFVNLSAGGTRTILAQATIEEAPATDEGGARPGPLLLPDLADPNARTGESLNEPGPRSGIPKALRGSASKSGGPANDLNPSGQAEPAWPPRGDLGRVIAGQELFHGNYCGTGQRGEGLPPIDALDAACMHHDACYGAAGHRSCACDGVLRREAATASEDPEVALEVRRRALSVAEAATAMGCKVP